MALLKISFITLLVFLAATLSSQISQSSPHPATATSALVDPQKGLYFLTQGFHLPVKGSDWINSNQENEQGVLFELKARSTARFSVRWEAQTASLTLENYAKKWIRDYSSYGFDLLGTRTFSENQNRGLLIDLFHPKSNVQMRQVVFMQSPRVVVLSCSDEKPKFESTLPQCNQLIRNFSWTSPSQKAP
ncbi:MAG: hypothetical protein LW875_08685 [Proteobacteria bacterium]|jgi:hypothetical protein|nr:hypothetical protein [Pseudomonadota bacterium]